MQRYEDVRLLLLTVTGNYLAWMGKELLLIADSGYTIKSINLFLWKWYIFIDYFFYLISISQN